MDLVKLLKGLAPTLATALLGPVGGLAVEVLGEALGIEKPTMEKVKDAFQSGQLTGEQIVAVKTAEQAFLVRCKELDIDLERVHAGDRDSARAMQKETRSRIPGVLAILITAGFFGILVGMMTGSLKASGNSEALLIMLGALGAAWGAVVNFYYGSSRGSDEKTAMLAKKA
jgi:hypothetical protein